jgi:hypothetical protein
LYVGLHVLEHLWLEQQLVHSFALDGILLDDRDHIFSEIGADVPQPFRQARRGGAQTRLALPRCVMEGDAVMAA